MRYLAPLLICLCVWPASATDTEPVTGVYSRPTVALADGQAVSNRRILGPTQELLPPVLARDTLYGIDYFEWCLRWNKLEEYLAEQRKISPLTIRGNVANHSSFAVGKLGTGLYGGTLGRVRTRATSQSREQIWRIGGYGGGPVTIYNPFVDNAAER